MLRNDAKGIQKKALSRFLMRWWRAGPLLCGLSTWSPGNPVTECDKNTLRPKQCGRKSLNGLHDHANRMILNHRKADQ